MTASQRHSSLPRLDGKQREVLDLPPSRYTVVLGSAGSGKTTMAIRRSLYLADKRTDHCGPTLLTTYNRSLVSYMKHLAGPHHLDVTIENFHTFARGYLASIDGNVLGSICGGPNKEAFISQSLAHVRKQSADNAILRRSPEFFSREIAWLQGRGIQELATYIEEKNFGASTGEWLARGLASLFDVFESYIELREKSGYSHDWDDLAVDVVKYLKSDTRTRKYRHIVIDEGQDFSPMMVEALSLAFTPDGSLTFFGDIAQQVYSHDITYRGASLPINESSIWRFERNYRNTQQIAKLALALAKDPRFKDDPDLVEPFSPVASGPVPALAEFENEKSEQKLILSLAQGRASNEKVGVFFRTQYEMWSMPANAIKIDRDLSAGPNKPGLFYGTYHAVKGFEFDTVFLPLLSSSRWPDPTLVRAVGEKAIITKDLKLLYVGITRAKTNLIISFSSKKSSLLPTQESLYRLYKRRG